MQAVTRVNAEQASKQVTRKPTPLTLGEGRCLWARRATDPAVPPGYWRRHACTRGRNATREARRGGGSWPL